MTDRLLRQPKWRHAALLLALIPVAVGVLVLVGWAAQIDALQTLVPGFVRMKANTAAGFLGLGLGGAILIFCDGRAARPTAAGLGALVLLIGLLTLIEYIVPANLGIDELLFRDLRITADRLPAGRMAPNTALNFALLGGSLLLLCGGQRAVRVGQGLAALALFIAGAALIGYLVGAQVFVTAVAQTQMALHTIVAFFCVGLALLLLRCDTGLMRVFVADTSGGLVARRALPSVLVLTVLLGVIARIGQMNGYYDAGFTVALIVSLNVFALATLTWFTAHHLDDAEQRRRLADARRVEASVREQSATQASKLKSEFLANMSHEIRTPMNGVIGMTSLLIDSPLNSAQREYVEVIRTSGETLMAIINDILDFSKIEAGKMALVAEAFPVADAVENALDVVAFRAHEKGLEVACDIAPDVPTLFTGDEVRLRQVLVNLLGNAVKFTGRGEIVVRVRVRARTPERCELEFSVQDTGAGIDTDSQKLLFNAFQQVDSSSTRRHGGTGLGLAICKRLVELMGGTIRVESTPGRGTTFTFTISGPADNHAPVTRRVAATPRSVLVVGGNATLRQIVQSQLASVGHRVVDAAGCEDALRLLTTGPAPDVIVTDLDLAGGDAIELARRLRAEPAWASLPLILLAPGRSSLDPESASLFTVQLLKPPKTARLLDAVRGAFDPVASGPSTDPKSAPSAPETAAARYPLQILVAEDNRVNQKVIQQLLHRMGYSATIVANGLEAVAAAAVQHFDLVLMDIQMPDMDGIEAMNQIRATLRSKTPRMVAVTASAFAEEQARLLAAGFDDYLSKPIPFDRLSELIQRHAALIRAKKA